MTQVISQKRYPKSEGIPKDEIYEKYAATLKSKNDLAFCTKSKVISKKPNLCSVKPSKAAASNSVTLTRIQRSHLTTSLNSTKPETNQKKP